MKQTILLLASLACFVSGAAIAGDKNNGIEMAPLPSQLLSSKRVFIANAGGSDLAYDSFYSEMKTWNRYELVRKPEEADLVFELSYGVQNLGTHVWSATNASTGTTQVFSAPLSDPQLTLTVYDRQSHTMLWSCVQHPGLARREKNREKELIKASQRLAQDLRRRTESTQR